MSIASRQIETLFNYLRTRENEIFFKQVAEDVKWTLMETHPLAGDYHSKHNFISSTFELLNRILKDGVVLKVSNIIVQNETAVVKRHSLSTALTEMPFNKTYCWVINFKNDFIVEVMVYVDSALVQKVIDDDEIESIA
jgi:ketosteroid isomerase-like protein